MPIYLYVKTHVQTGLKYLGKTTQDPFKYYGSGIRWLNHLNKHGYTISTQIICESEDAQYIAQQGVYYSVLWDVVDSPDWANLKLEEGDGGFSHLNDGSVTHVERCIKAGRKAYENLQHHACIHTRQFLKQMSEKGVDKLSQLRQSNPEKYHKNHQGDNNPMFGKVWCVDIADPTNIDKRILAYPKSIPEGYVPVNVYKDSLKNKKSVCYGKMWIHNPATRENKYIHKVDIIPEGWYKGRRMEYYQKKC
jgi:hypothetical protein